MNTFAGFCNTAESHLNGVNCYAFVKKNNDFTHLERFIRSNWNNEYFVEKTPFSMLCLPQLYNRYPNANYLFLERHPVRTLLSQMNYYPPGETDRKKRMYDLKIGYIEEEDLLLNYEQHRANQVLKMVRSQVIGKPLFANQLTTRYENLVNNIEPELLLLKDKFDIIPDVERARKVLARPSVSSRNNRYDIKSLSDPEAIKMMREACYLWHYDYSKLFEGSFAVKYLSDLITLKYSQVKEYVNNNIKQNPLGEIRGQLSSAISVAVSDDAQGQRFTAQLTGQNEVPPTNTRAIGDFEMELSSDGTISNYVLNITNMSNVTSAHIHEGEKGVNGPIVLTLYKSENPQGEINGILSKGRIDSDLYEELFVGKYNSDLINLIYEKGAYVNVNTKQNPHGEIRGQLLNLTYLYQYWSSKVQVA
jgi:CHRD domain/Sulfotransferase family